MFDRSLNPLQQLSYILGSISKELMYWIFTLVYVLFLLISNIDIRFIIALILITSALSFIIDPIIALVIDNTRSKLGKFRPWIITGAITNSIATLLLFYWPSLSGTYLYIYVTLCYVLFVITYSIVDIPFMSLIQAHYLKRRDREILATLLRVGVTIGSVLLILFAFDFILDTARSLNTTIKNAFIYICYIVIPFFLASQLLVVYAFKAKYRYIRVKPISLISLSHIFKDNDQIKYVIALATLVQIAICIINFVAINYLQETFFFYAPIFVATAALTMFASFALYLILRKYVSQTQFFIGSALILLLCALTFFVLNIFELKFLTLSAIVYSLCFATTGILAVCVIVMTADCIDYGEFKVGVRSEAVIFASQSIALKVGFAIATMIASFNLPINCFLKLFSVSNLSANIGLGPSISLPFIALLLIYIYKKLSKLNGSFFSSSLETVDQMRDRRQVEINAKLILRYALNKKAIHLNLDTKSLDETIEYLAGNLVNIGIIVSKNTFLDEIHKKLENSNCGIMDGIAIPHLTSNCITRPTVAIARLSHGIDCKALDHKNCDLIFLIVTPKDGFSHLNILGRLSLLLNEHDFVSKLRLCVSADDILEKILIQSVTIQKRDL